MTAAAGSPAPPPVILRGATYLDAGLRPAFGDLHLGAGRIEAITPAGRAGGAAGAEQVDCAGRLVIPGLVNAHFHSQSTLERGLSRDLPIQAWQGDSPQGRAQRRLFSYLDQEASDDELVALCQRDYVRLLRQGVTCTQDSGLAERSPLLYARAMAALGMRGVVDGYDHLPALPARVGEGVRFTGHLPEEEDLSEETLARAAAAHALGRGMSTHCLETVHRRSLALSRFGCSTVALFAGRGLLDRQSLLFHCKQADARDVELLAGHGAQVVFCPDQSLAAGEVPARISALLTAGVPVSLGTDWADTSFWAAMRLAYLLLKVGIDPGRHPAETVWRMATTTGAAALWPGEPLGKLAAGAHADLVLLDADAADVSPRVDRPDFSTFAHNLLHAGSGEAVTDVMVAGRWIIRDGRLQTADEAALERRYAETLAGLFPASPP